MMAVSRTLRGRTVDFQEYHSDHDLPISVLPICWMALTEGNISEEATEYNERSEGHFRPEFLNRLDEIIMFKPLTKDNISGIISDRTSE